MKFLKILLIVVVTLIALFFIIGLFLPKNYAVERSTVINAPDSTIYNNIADFNEFLKWNPWSKMDPAAKVTISGVPGAVGHLYEWTGKESGQGQMKIMEITPSSMVDIELKFIKPFESLADTKFTITPVAGGNKVTWSMAGTADNIINRWMCLMMDSMVGKDFDSGLASLKAKSETR